MSASSGFYAGLPLLADFSDLTRAERFAPLPADWHVAACDVRDSSGALRAGNYKHVNTVAAAAVTAVLNAAGDTEVPFIFEGDGSTFCVPAELLGDVSAALAKTREMASRSFGLELRVATLPVERVRAAGFDILVARHRVSENYVQAVFAGGGIAWAERYMKDAATAPLCAVDAAPRGSHEGLECRWQDIPSPHGETVSLMVRAAGAEPNAVYRALIMKIRETYGSEELCHPLTVPALAMSLGAARLGNEVGVRRAGEGAWGRWRYLMRVRLVVLLGWLLMRFGIRTQETDWAQYKPTLVRNSDVRKFNDVYRQILAGTAAQRVALEAWLEERFRRGELAYGLHVSDRAHMTCLVFNYSGKHLHFIDGADGGLFSAAKDFKDRVARLA